MTYAQPGNSHSLLILHLTRLARPADPGQPEEARKSTVPVGVRPCLIPNFLSTRVTQVNVSTRGFNSALCLLIMTELRAGRAELGRPAQFLVHALEGRPGETEHLCPALLHCRLPACLPGQPQAAARPVSCPMLEHKAGPVAAQSPRVPRARDPRRTAETGRAEPGQALPSCIPPLEGEGAAPATALRWWPRCRQCIDEALRFTTALSWLADELKNPVSAERLGCAWAAPGAWHMLVLALALRSLARAEGGRQCFRATFWDFSEHNRWRRTPGPAVLPQCPTACRWGHACTACCFPEHSALGLAHWVLTAGPVLPWHTWVAAGSASPGCSACS